MKKRAKRLAVLLLAATLTTTTAATAFTVNAEEVSAEESVSESHNFSKYGFDKKEHWKVCADDGCNETEDGTREEHKYGTEGKEEFTCKTCGFVNEEKKAEIEQAEAERQAAEQAEAERQAA
ncbi:MAG: hypothetical protein HUJ72_04285, partial [Blautia sp.]|nr:hypothetical protein [Blautia sp.]